MELPADAWEALRLCDHLGLGQGAAAQHLGVSRPTVGRLLDLARRRVATALVEGRALLLPPPAPHHHPAPHPGAHAMTIAFTTTPDRSALAPFGHGATTLLADLHGDQVTGLRELPPVEGCCGAVAQALAGCQAVFCTGVGRGAANHLAAAGVAVVLSPAVSPAEAVRRWRAGQGPADNAGCGCGGEGHGHAHGEGGCGGH